MDETRFCLNFWAWQFFRHYRDCKVNKMLVEICVLLSALQGFLCIKFDINNLSPVFTDTPEERVTWRVDHATDWEFLRGKNNDADKLGLLLTGISEFPWIVDLRVDNVEEDRWSTGNLVSFMYVLTTCRAAKILTDDSTLNGTAVKVTFAQQYLWEYLDRLKKFPDGEDYQYGGTRISEEVISHPNCNIDESLWDAAILKLSYGIQPAAPVIGYIPIVENYIDGSVPDDVDLTNMEKQRLVCFVASIGRKYRNSRNNLVLDFKVKHRVYLEKWSECYGMSLRMCKDNEPGNEYCSSAHFSDPGAEGRNWLCFRTRAKVGTVCDHDRGAPLVCGGEVYGIVVMGALGTYCNSLLMVQFVVAKITTFRGYFERFIEKKNNRRKRVLRSTAVPTLSFRTINPFLNLLILLFTLIKK